MSVRLPLALFLVAFAAQIALAFGLSSPPPQRPRTGADVIGLVSPAARRVVGDIIWIRLLQDIPSDNERGPAAMRDEAARYDLLVEYLPGMVPAYLYGAEVLDRWGGHDEAIRLLERGVAATGDVWLAIRLGANTFMIRDKNYPAAIKVLERASQIEGHPFFVERMLAKCHENLGDTPAARAILSDLLARTAPDSIDRQLTERDLARLDTDPQ